MAPASNINILFILNPVSGGKNKTKWQPVIRDYFKSLPQKIDFFTLTGTDDAESIKSAIEKSAPEKVVAVGGDGTVSLVANQLLNSSIPMGILRGGSANGMATELDIPEDPKSQMDLIVNGRISKCDVIKINDKDICLHLSDFGLNARIVKYFDKSSFRGMWAYGRVFLKILLQRKLFDAHIIADNLDEKIHAYMIVIANATKYGTGAVINPDGKIDDGKFELVVVRKISLVEFFKMFISGKPFNPQKVEIFQTTHAEITIKKAIHFQIDGEYKGKRNEAQAVIIPSALNVIV
ncbi:MAG: diacylglycerol/lipid kinase family protein [Ginsengibacter sp.]